MLTWVATVTSCSGVDSMLFARTWISTGDVEKTPWSVEMGMEGMVISPSLLGARIIFQVMLEVVRPLRKTTLEDCCWRDMKAGL